MFRKSFQAIRNYKHIEWVIVSALFLLATAVYMGQSFTQFDSTVLGKPGDHTSGIMYANFTHPARPWVGTSHVTNYPYGENLRIPISATTQGQLLSHWFLAKVTNLVAGWNIMVLLGYFCNALIMYAFIRRLTSNKWAAFFGGYAIAFTPYHAFASTGQIAGMFSGLFVIAIWRFIALWENPNRRNALILGTIFGISFYTDGYFILLGLTMIGAFWVALLSYYLLLARTSIKTIRTQLQYFALSNLVVLAFLLPLIWVNIAFASQIGEILGNARSGILIEAQTYSARLLDYINPASILYLGISILCLALISITDIGNTLRSSSQKTLAKVRSPIFAGWTLLTVSLLSLWLSLQPTVSIGKITLYNPSYLVVSLTSVWRVFGRLYILVSIGVVVLAALGLKKLLERYPRQRIIIFVLAMAIMIIELGIPSLNFRQPNFSYKNNVPNIYNWVKPGNPGGSTRAIAEYPLEGFGHEADYFTFLQVSEKPIINANLHNSPQLELKQSIIGINDPQTLPVLRALGVDVINIRDVSRKKAGKELTLRRAAHTNEQLRFIMSHRQPEKNIDSFTLLPGKTNAYALTIKPSASLHTKLKSDGTAEYIFKDSATLNLGPLPGASKQQSSLVSFDLASNISRKATILQNGALLWAGSMSSTKQNIQFTALSEHPIVIYTEGIADSPTEATLTNLQAL